MKNKGTQKEKAYDSVYGNTFSLYKREDLEDFIFPLTVRWQLNNLNASKTFEGMNCLDAGCGNGRGTIFMYRHGAKSVTSLDVSPTNLKSTAQFVKSYGFRNHKCQLASLESIPFEDDKFDFVWCNGVIMHTSHPNKCLSELARVLRLGGRSWLYIYGSGGVYWRIMHGIRRELRGQNVDAAIAYLRILRYEPRYIAEFIDDWFASHLRAYTHKDLSSRLVELGYDSVERLPRGMAYDTSERRYLFKGTAQRELMGEGDLRYLLTKTRRSRGSHHSINETEYGSAYVWPKAIESLVDRPLKSLIKESKTSILLKMSAFAYLQRELRILMSQDTAFNAYKLAHLFEFTIEECRKSRGLV